MSYPSKTSNFELKPFDLNLINNLLINHPFQKAMSLTVDYFDSYRTQNDNIDYELVTEFDYFDSLDNFYSYGITFLKSDIYSGNFLFVNHIKVINQFHVPK